jgi:thymidylate synthase
MNKADTYYLQNINNLINKGYHDEHPRPKYKDGTLAYSTFLTQVFEEYDISKNEFPITTLRNTAIKTGIREVLWIYQKQSNILSDAHDLGIKWWDEWNIGDGTIGQRYGATIKKWNMMNTLLDGLMLEPFSRRHIITMYQQQDLNETAGLFPCAYETLWSVRNVKDCLYLDMTLIQRSSDFLMAKSINSSQYVALQMMVAGHLNYKVGKFCHMVQNLHVYDRHTEALNEILNKPALDEQPILKLKVNKDFYDYTVDDFIIENVENITKIKSPLEIAI